VAERPETIIAALPCWRGPLSLTPLHGGLSNASFLARDLSGSYVARFGQDFPFHYVSRVHEAAASRWAAEAGIAPRLHFAGQGCLVSAFIDGRTLDADELAARRADAQALIARVHRDLKRRARGDAPFFWPFAVLRGYEDALLRAKHPIAPELPRLLSIVDSCEAAQAPMPIVFGHHDLLPANFLDDGKRLWLVDWEYAGLGTPMFDLANFAVNAGLDEAGGHALLSDYFGRPADNALWRAFRAMRLASALREWLWACVSEVHLKAPGADYAAYAATCRAAFDAAMARDGDAL